MARTVDEEEGVVADRAGLEDEDEDKGVVAEWERKRRENTITSPLRVVAASELIVSLAQLGVKQGSEDVMEEETVECADFEERLAVGAEARRDLRGRDPSDLAEREARLGLVERRDDVDRPSGFGDGGVEMSLSSVAFSCASTQRPRSNLR